MTLLVCVKLIIKDLEVLLFQTLSGYLMYVNIVQSELPDCT